METVIANLAGRVRRETWNGKSFLVAPLTMIVPGVLNGSKGPLYYPPDEVARDPSAWNHMPIVVYHPMVNGLPVSARDPGILERQGIGFVFRSGYRGKLIAEGWFDEERTRQVDARILNALEKGEQTELSTGLGVDSEPAPDGAVHNGQPYSFTARNYRPDHLAVLPDQVGACSLKDGCGVLVNSATPGAWQPVDNCGESYYPDPAARDTDGSWSLGVRQALVRMAFREAYPVRYDPRTGMSLPHAELLTIFDAALIYRDAEGELQRLAYEIDAKGAVSFGSDPKPVEKEVRYVPVTNEHSWSPL